MHVDPTHYLGEKDGEAAHTLLASEMPGHTHIVSTRTTASTSLPAGAGWAALPQPAYAATTGTSRAVREPRAGIIEKLDLRQASTEVPPG
ncbi:hypothetical protein [Pseudonocardia sp.]|jgi:microcystin-dependent protein|uniref:hypothetical protein n=1 Tax=Pseudonocardia sp. TaxID=60912 RepID=UPI0031FD2B88